MSDSDENIPYGRKFGSGFRGTRYDGTVTDDVENTPIIPDADETLIESLCILPASPNEKPIRKHVIVTYMADGSEIHTKPITYCPFCGRKL